MGGNSGAGGALSVNSADTSPMCPNRTMALRPNLLWSAHRNTVRAFRMIA